MRAAPPVALLVAAILTAALAACGGSEEDGSTRSAGSTGQTTPTGSADPVASRAGGEAPGASEEEREAGKAVASFYEILGSDSAQRDDRTAIDSAAFCELMSEEAREQTVRYAKASSGIAREWDCEAAVELLVLRSKGRGFEGASRVEVVGVNAEGDRATASVRFGGGPIATLPLVREDDGWKIAASPAE